MLLAPLALPVWLITAFLIFVDSPGAVTFKSIRVGKGGREFEMLKFRKMRNTARGGPLTWPTISASRRSAGFSP